MSKPNLRKSENSPWFLSRYCGINFGVLRSQGFPVHAVDYLCYLHDNAYQDLIDNGKSKEAYLEWNYADEAFITGLEKLLTDGVEKSLHEHVVLQVAKGLFELKKAVVKKGETKLSPEDLEGNTYLLPKKYLQYNVSPDGSIEVEKTATQSEFITPDRPPKRIPHSIAPKHPDLKTLLQNAEREDDEDLMLAVNLSESFRNSPSSTDIDTGGEDMSAGQLDATPITKATPVYGEQNSQTIISPWNGIFSVYNLAHDRVNRVDIRMTAPYDIMRTYMEAIDGNARPTSEDAENVLYRRPMFQGTPYVPARGFIHANVAQPGQTAALPLPALTTTVLTGPEQEIKARYIAANTTFPTGGSNKERGYWFDYYANNYKYYTVLGCEYEIKVTNVSETPGADILVGYLPTSRVKPPVKASYGNPVQFAYAKPVDAIAWKGVKWQMCNSDKGQNGINNILTIKGTYKRGQNNQLEIMNDDKREIWNPMGQLPQVPEDLSLIFMRAPSAYCAEGSRPTINVYLQMKYIVQFKELVEAMEYPIGTSDAFGKYTTPISSWRDVQTTPSADETAVKNTTVYGSGTSLIREVAKADKFSEMDMNVEDS
jgi:hypothetical protein